MERLSRRFRETFSRGKRRQTADQKDSAPINKKKIQCKVALLDSTDLTVNLDKKAYGKDLLQRVLLHLDLIEKDYFGLQFMDTKQVPHWLDPTKKIKKQVKIGPVYTLHFRVKFYAADPNDLHEELTRYHYFLQLKQDIGKGRLKPTSKQLIDLSAFAVQSELGDYDPQLHSRNYISEFRFVPDQTEEIERAIEKKHKALLGMNPAECETAYLKIAKNLEMFGIDLHAVQMEEADLKKHKFESSDEVQLGLMPRGIMLLKNDRKSSLFVWSTITNMTFKKRQFILAVQTSEAAANPEMFHFLLPTSRASKHLWKCAVEFHTFFRMVKTAEPRQERTGSLLRFGSRFRYSGRTLYQASLDDSVNARRGSMMFKRTRSERFAQRSTIGYIRVGSHVWAKAINGDYYRGQVTTLSEKVYIKFEDNETIAHDRSDENSIVYDMDPNPNEIKLNTRVIAHWSGLSAYLPGIVAKIEGNKYYVHYEDGDKAYNRIGQLRILKPPLYFGPGSGHSKVQKRLSMKATSLMGPGDERPDGNTRSSSNGHQMTVDVTSHAHPSPNTPSRGDDVFFKDTNSPHRSHSLQKENVVVKADMSPIQFERSINGPDHRRLQQATGKGSPHMSTPT